MNDHVTAGPANSPETVGVATSPAIVNITLEVPGDAIPAIRYATDAEVDKAMEKIFVQHDRLFTELAK